VHGSGLHTCLLPSPTLNSQKQVRLLHLLGRPGELSPAGLADWLPQFPNLQGVVLQGCATPDLLEALLKADLAVLVLPFDTPMADLESWYYPLQHGRSLYAATRAWQGSLPPRPLPVSYELADDYWGWAGKKPRLTPEKLPTGFFYLDENLPAVSQPLRLHRSMPMPAGGSAPLAWDRPGPRFAAAGLILALLATGLTLYSLLDAIPGL